MKFTKVLKDKKGAALEMAIFFMIIVFCFCTLLTTMTLTARSRIKLEKIYFELDLDNDPIAEEIAADCLRYLDFLANITMRNANNQFEFLPANLEAALENENDKNYAFNYNSQAYYLSFIRGENTLPSRYADYTEVDVKGQTVLINPFSQVDYDGDKTLICTLILQNKDREPITVMVAYTLNEYGTGLTKEIIQDK